MPETIIQPRSNIDWGALGQSVAQPIAQSRSLEQQLIPLLLKHKLDQVAEINKLNYADELEKRKDERTLQLFQKLPHGTAKIKRGPNGLHIEPITATERKAEQGFAESQGVGSVLDRFRKYALAESRFGIPTIDETGVRSEIPQNMDMANRRIGQLEGKLISKYPSQMDIIKGVMSGTKTTAANKNKQVVMNPDNFATGMAQMFKNTEDAFPNSSTIPALQRLKTGYGTLPWLSTKTGVFATAKSTGEVSSLKVRARSFLKNFENNRFTNEDIQQAVDSMTDATKTTEERLGTIVNVSTAAGAANGIPALRIKERLAKELGITVSQMDDIVAQKPNARNALKPNSGKSNYPPIGTSKNGYTYKGGDPALPSSWRKN